MNLHANAKLGLAGRYALVRAIEEGLSLLAGIVRRARSTIWKVLRRHCLSRLPRLPQPARRRCEWSRPGALLHIDVKRLGRFDRPGHRVTGNRRSRSRRVGYDYLHCVVDDNSRYAYVELHPREDSDTAARVLERALAHLAELGLQPGEAVMTDNALAYTRGRLAEAQAAARERDTRTRTLPSRPRRPPAPSDHHTALHTPVARELAGQGFCRSLSPCCRGETSFGAARGECKSGPQPTRHHGAPVSSIEAQVRHARPRVS